MRKMVVLANALLRLRPMAEPQHSSIRDWVLQADLDEGRRSHDLTVVERDGRRPQQVREIFALVNANGRAPGVDSVSGASVSSSGYCVEPPRCGVGADRGDTPNSPGVFSVPRNDVELASSGARKRVARLMRTQARRREAELPTGRRGVWTQSSA